MAENSRISMDETFVFLRKGSKRRPSQVATNTVDREDVLCAIPKPSYNFLFILSIIQFIIIIAGCIAFGALGHLTCQHFVSEKCEEITANENKGNHLKNENTVTEAPDNHMNSNYQNDATAIGLENLSTISKTKTTNGDSQGSSSSASEIRSTDTLSKRSFLGNSKTLQLKGESTFFYFPNWRI